MFHEATKLVLGRGEVYFDRFDPVTQVGDGERYLGNTPSFQVSRDIRRLERSRSYGGQVHSAPGIVISENVTIRMTTDNMDSENVDLWLSSEGVPTTVGDELVPYTESFTNVKLGRYYQLGMSQFPGGLRYVDQLQLVRGANPPRLGIEYTFDRDRGRFRLLHSSTRISDGHTVQATYVKRPSTNRVTTIASNEVMGSMRYVATDPHGPRVDYWFPRVRISPRGAVEMKSDEFRQMQFDVTAIRLGPQHPLLYAIQDGVAPQPITADTTLITADTNRYRADNGAWNPERT